MEQINKELKGYMSDNNVVCCSEKLNKLIDKDAELFTKMYNLVYNYKISFGFKEIKKIIKFYSEFSESINLSFYNQNLYMECENVFNDLRIINKSLNTDIVPEKADLTACNKYSLEYLKAFIDSFKNKELFEITIYLNDNGEYPLLIEYKRIGKDNLNFICIAPRRNNN